MYMGIITKLTHCFPFRRTVNKLAIPLHQVWYPDNARSHSVWFHDPGVRSIGPCWMLYITLILEFWYNHNYWMWSVQDTTTTPCRYLKLLNIYAFNTVSRAFYHFEPHKIFDETTGYRCLLLKDTVNIYFDLDNLPYMKIQTIHTQQWWKVVMSFILYSLGSSFHNSSSQPRALYFEMLAFMIIPMHFPQKCRMFSNKICFHCPVSAFVGWMNGAWAQMKQSTRICARYWKKMVSYLDWNGIIHKVTIFGLSRNHVQRYGISMLPLYRLLLFLPYSNATG